MALRVIDLIEGCDIYYVVEEQQPVSHSASTVTRMVRVIKTLTPRGILAGPNSIKFMSGHVPVELPVTGGYVLGYHSTYHGAAAELTRARAHFPIPIPSRKKRYPLRRLSDLAGPL